MDKYGFIYEWINIINQKKYIGSHWGDINDGYLGSGKLFLKAVNKYGIDNFNRRILEIVYEREELLSREKYYLDCTQAYYSRDYYNIAKDVIGGNTKAGWTDKERKKFSLKIKNVWLTRSLEEKNRILTKTWLKTKEWLKTEEGLMFRDRANNNMKYAIAASKNRTFEQRSKSAKLGKANMGEEKRKLAAKKGFESRTPESIKTSIEKTKITRSIWSEEKRLELFNKQSNNMKGKFSGEKNPRARRIIANNMEFSTLKEAMRVLNLSENRLYRWLKDPTNLNFYYYGDKK